MNNARDDTEDFAGIFSRHGFGLIKFVRRNEVQAVPKRLVDFDRVSTVDGDDDDIAEVRGKIRVDDDDIAVADFGFHRIADDGDGEKSFFAVCHELV